MLCFHTGSVGILPVRIIWQHVLTNFIDYGMSYVDNEAQFRFPIAFQIIFALITMAMMYFLPESPRWVSFQRSSLDLGL